MLTWARRCDKLYILVFYVVLIKATVVIFLGQLGIRGSPRKDQFHWKSYFRMVWFLLVKMEAMNLSAVKVYLIMHDGIAGY